MPYRLGPTRFGPPLSKVWQAAHCLAAASPFLGSELASRTAIGSAGSGFATSPPADCSGTAMSYPGLASFGGVKIAPAAMFRDRTPRHVASTAPRILLSSKESIGAPGRDRGRRARGEIRSG